MPPLIDHSKKEILFNIALFGSRQSGKFTSLEWIHKSYDNREKGDIQQVAVPQGKLLRLELKPLLAPNIFGLRPKFHIYTAQNKSLEDNLWKSLLSEIDGFIFIADSQKSHQKKTLQAWEKLQKLVDSEKLKNGGIPFIMQWNKRDLPNILSKEWMEEHLNTYSKKSVETIALIGEGVKITTIYLFNEFYCF